MLTDENWNEKGDAISYAFFSWYTMTEEQRDAVIEKMGTGYDDWVKSLGKIGTLGVYSTDVTDQLDELTGCTEHTKLGESSDGNMSIIYTYPTVYFKCKYFNLISTLE